MCQLERLGLCLAFQCLCAHSQPPVIPIKLTRLLFVDVACAIQQNSFALFVDNMQVTNELFLPQLAQQSWLNYLYVHSFCWEVFLSNGNAVILLVPIMWILIWNFLLPPHRSAASVRGSLLWTPNFTWCWTSINVHCFVWSCEHGLFILDSTCAIRCPSVLH